jgi:hypothetical protein
MIDAAIKRLRSAVEAGEFNFGEVCCGKGECNGSPFDPPECCGRPDNYTDNITTLLDHVERVPRDAIEKLLSEAMDRAVANGANSVSMPDEYVEIAAWLCGVRSKE